MNINQQLKITTLLLILSIILLGVSSIDVVIADKFYNPNTQSWILDKELQPYKFIFYDGIKKLLILLALLFLGSLIFFRKSSLIQHYKKGIILVILSAIMVPLVVGGFKKITNMPCPKNEISYGGTYPSTKVWESYPQTFQPCNKTCCFPAGHASGGFALLSLFFLFKSRRNKILAIIGALTIGWSMGLYKMLIGDHFFSHTVITMILAWLIILFIQKFIDYKP
jgi:membrane-associated PAP2 superfamily phosphatase